MKQKVAALGTVILLAVGVWSLTASQSQESKKGEKGMRLAKPRIAPLTEAEWTDEQRKLLEPFHQEGKTYNVIGTLAVMRGQAAGLTDAEIARIKEGPDVAGWAPFDAALLRAADELHRDAMISDKTWAALSERYNTKQLMDVVFAVGQYHLVSMSLNTFGVQLDKGVKGF